MTQGNEGIRLTSPQEMFNAACEMMLGGREPKTQNDWELVIDFFTVNVVPSVRETAIPFVMMLFECPMTPEEIVERIQLCEFISAVVAVSIIESLVDDLTK